MPEYCAYSHESIDPVYDPVKTAPDGKVVLAKYLNLYIDKMKNEGQEEKPKSEPREETTKEEHPQASAPARRGRQPATPKP